MRLQRLLFYLLSCGAALFTAAVWYDRLSMAPYRSLTLPITNLSFDIQVYRSISGASEGVLIHPTLSTMSHITTLHNPNKKLTSLDSKQRESNTYPNNREYKHDSTNAQSTVHYKQKSSTKYYTVADQDDPFNLKIAKQSTPKYSNQGKRRKSNAFDTSNHRKAKLDSPSKDNSHKSSTTRDAKTAFKLEETRRNQIKTHQNDAFDTSNPSRKANLDTPSKDNSNKSSTTRDGTVAFELEQTQKKKTDQNEAFDISNHRKANLDNPSNDANHRSSKTRDAWRIEQARRQARLRKACAGWNKSHRDVLSASRDELFHLLVDDKHQAIYCYVPKVGCTNWKRLWMMLTGLSNETDPLNIPQMLPHDSHHAMMLIHQNNTKQLTEMKLKKYKKLMVVRDPYERLLSAFKDKLEQPGNEYYQTNVGDRIRKARFWEFQHGEGNITFPQFVSFVNSMQRGKFDEHWKPYSLTCFPCAIHYDVIGKYETLVKDSERFLRMIGAPEDLHFPPYRPGNTSTLLPKYLAQLSPRQLTKLNKVYKDDLEAFDYKPWSPQDVGLT